MVKVAVGRVILAIDLHGRSFSMPAASAGTTIIECCWCLGGRRTPVRTITM
jgi:hypothetical protein